MYLKYAVNDAGELVYIEQVRRGRTALHCPYCGGLLTARKGAIVSAHFAHSGETCRQVQRDQNIELPVYDNFNIFLPGRVIEALQAFDERGDYSNTGLLSDRGLITYNQFARSNNWELTNLGKIPLGKLSLMLFCGLQEGYILRDHNALHQMVVDVYERPQLEVTTQSTNWEQRFEAQSRLGRAEGMDLETALADLRIYRAQWRRILGLTLYCLSITGNGEQYYKIGVTGRPINERLKEIRADLEPLLGQIAITVVDTFFHRGNVELYFKYRYAANAVKLGTLTEYFQFPEPSVVTRDLRRMKEKTLTDLEQAVLNGSPAEIESRIRRDEIEGKRRAAISRGMARARKKGNQIGRPVIANEQYAERYPAVVEALVGGLSLRRTAELTGVAVNTVRKVQTALKEEAGSA